MPPPRLRTYASATYDFESDSTEFSTGPDVGMRLNSELTSAFPLNPDFGQVEADPDTIELRETERFLRERRTFFREGSELFDTPVNIYYSRRFEKIDAGGKVTGQGDTWALGLVDVQGDIDTFAFEATLGDRVFVALDGDPERDGTGTDPPNDDPKAFHGKLVIYDPDEDVLISDISDSNSIQSPPDYPAQYITPPLI